MNGKQLIPHSGVGTVPTPPALARRLARTVTPHGEPLGPVLDPACGDGELLLAALEQRGRDPEYARRGLHGIELDPARAERCRARLRRAAGLPAGTDLDAHIVCADALHPSLGWPAGTSVLANPPWISLSGRASRALAADLRRSLRTGTGLGGWPSIHAAFTERIARHVARTGLPAGLLLPASVAHSDSHRPLRLEVTGHARVSGPVRELGEDAFPGVLEPAVMVALEHAAAPAPSSRPWLGVAPDDAALLARLEVFPRLPAHTFADVGVHTGNCSALLVRRDGPPRGPGLREGRCLRAFALAPPRAWLDLAVERMPGRRFRAAPPERYADFPLLVRQTADRPIAALHEPALPFRNSLLAARPVPDLDPAFVVAVLNAPVAAAWHRRSFRDARQRAFPQVKVAHLASQPFPIARRAEDPRLHDEIAAAARALQRAGAGSEDARERLDRRVLEAYGLESGALAHALRASH